ncbi:MAG TPA: type II toxin-antitoxin system prevent-host-death family antitoxin [Methylocystis sp.]|nr:type II toxin-antitoxin system prevent-host-death family antitoxin [Methylocystis sp.]
MKKVTSADMARKFSEFCDVALHEPIIVTKNGRERLVLLGVDEYNCLRDLAAEKEQARAAAISGDGRARAAAVREG